MYRLRLLGGVALEGPDGPVSGRAAQPRRLALLAVLGASNGPGSWSREKLIALLWPDTDPNEARRNLSQSVYLLRQAIGEDSIVSRGETLALNPDVVRTDVDAFKSAAEDDRFSEAADEYGGPFLDGFFIRGTREFEEWTEAERRRLADQYAGCLEAAAIESLGGGDHLRAADRWRRLIEHDPYNSRAVVGLMEALSESGDPGNALLVADEHATRMGQDLGVGVPAEIEHLVTRIRQDRPSWTPRAADGRREAEATRDPIVTTLQSQTHFVTRRIAVRWAAALLIVLAFVWGIRGLMSPAAAPPHDSVGVLPFLNLTGDADLEYLVDGVTDELVARLSVVPSLRVPAQTSSFHFKDRRLDVRAIADSLGVEKVLEGSVRGAGQGLVVTAQLIDANSGYHLWTETYETRSTDLRTTPGDLVAAVAEVLGVADAIPAQARRPQTGNLAAWHDYQRARHWWLKRSQVGTDSAIYYFSRAAERDSSNARAWAGLASVFATGLYWKYLPNTDSIHAAARESADRAYSLDSTLPEVATTHAALLFSDRDLDAAEAEVRRAIDSNPNYPDAHQVFAEILHWTGRGAEAVEEARAAYLLDPMSPFRGAFLGNMLNSELRLEEAVEQWDHAIALEPEHLGAHRLKAWALLCLGRTEEAREARRRVVEISGLSDADAQVLYYLRDYEGALTLIDALREDPQAVSSRSTGRGRHRSAAPEPRIGAQIASWVYAELEQWDEAVAEYRLSANDYPGEAKTAMLLAFIYASQGEGERARELLSAPGEIKDPPGFQAQSATVWAELGEHERAVAALERAYAGRKSSVMSAAINPRFDALRGVPRFERFLDRIGLPTSAEIEQQGRSVMN